MTFYSYDGGNTENLPELFLMGTQLREVRRSRGLSQTQLAELMGIAQPNISRWESGVEQASPECLGKLTDILLNKSGRLDRYIEKLVAREPSINVFSLHKNNGMRFQYISDEGANAYQLEKNEYLGEDIGMVFDIDWRSEIFDDIDFREMIHSEYDHDMVPLASSQQVPTQRIHVSSYVMEFDGGSTILITNTHFSPATGEAASQKKRIMACDMGTH